MAALFGVAGNCDEFSKVHKSSLQMPQYLKDKGLGLYEYQCGRGVTISKETAEELKRKSKDAGITLTVHAPYFISLSSVEEEKRRSSIRYILGTLVIADCMGAERIVVHSGSCAKLSREDALTLAKETISKAIAEADSLGLGHIHICPETMGKINQLGTLSEVIELCQLDERLIPCVDFGHINAREQGALKETENFMFIFDEIEDKLGIDRLKSIHIHYSRIEFTEGGEKKHHRYIEDTQFGPDFLPIAEITAKKNLSPYVVCESRGTQTRDSVIMQNEYIAATLKYNA